MQESVPPCVLLDLSSILSIMCFNVTSECLFAKIQSSHSRFVCPTQSKQYSFCIPMLPLGNCSALLYPFHFKNGDPSPYLMPVAHHSYFYKALGMTSAGSVLIKPMSSLPPPLPGSPDTSHQLIHCFGLSMKNLPKASGTVWGSCRTLRKKGLAC